MSSESPTPHWSDLPHAPPTGAVLLPLDQIEDGQVRLIQMALQGSTAPFGILLMRSGKSLRAYVNRCAHFGAPLSATQVHLKFVPHESVTCNVHYARYRWDDGVCDRGDCVGESLLPIPVMVDTNGCVIIAPQA